MVIAMLITFRAAREARSAIFPIVREEESLKARRARVSIFLWAAVTALFLGGWLASIRLTTAGNSVLIAGSTPVQFGETVVAEFATATSTQASQFPGAMASVDEDGQPLIQSVLTNTATPPTASPILITVESPTPMAPAATPNPTETPVSATATPTETATPVPPTPTPTPVPQTATSTPAAFSAVRIPTSAPRTPAPPGAKMGPIQFSTEITDQIEPINPRDIFLQDVETIYAVYPYSGMQNGLNFRAVWYQNGVEFARDERQWEWGDQARSYSYLVPPGEGLYKLELYVNDSILATGLFEIR